MIIFLKLILAHLLGDFLFQPKSWVIEKERKKWRSPKLYLHVLVHGVLVFLLLGKLKLWYLAVIVAVAHFFIDVLKLVRQTDANKQKWFVGDQVLHIISLLVLWTTFFEPPIDALRIYQNTEVWLYLTALFFLTLPSSVLLQVLLSNWTRKIKEGENDSLANAGKYIGVLERLFVFLFVVANHWEAVGFLLTAKSVFRFGDLKESKDRKLTEYILIGTLLSFGLAIFVGITVLEVAN